MSLVSVIILNKALGQQIRYSGSKNSRKVVDNARQNSNSGGRPTYSFEEYMYYKVKDDPKLSSFFKVLGQYGQEIDKIDKEKVLEEFQGLCHLYEEKEKEVNERVSELEGTGMHISKEIRTEETCAPVKVEDGRGFAGVGEYSYSNSRTFAIGFNGIKITSEMLSGKNGNIYQQEYELWQKENPDIDKTEIDLAKRLEDKKRRLKITVFNREKAKEEIAEMEKELESVRTRISNGKTKKEKMNIFDNLTEEQKKAISNYLEAVNACKIIGKDISERITESINLGRGESDIKRDKWQRAFDKMIEDGAVSQDIIDDINTILSQEIEEKQEEYDKGEAAYRLNDMGRGMANGVSWYIREQERTYQEKTLLQQKEEELSSLEAEEKTISEAEALIDRQTGKDGRNIGEE